MRPECSKKALEMFFLYICCNLILKMLLILQVQCMQTSKSFGSIRAELLPHGVEASE